MTFGRRVLVNPRDRKRTEQLIDDCHIFDGVHGERCNLSGMPTVTDYHCPPGYGFFDTEGGFIQIVIPSHKVER